MKLKLLTFLLVFALCSSCTAQDKDDTDKIVTQRITSNEGMNNAFTDLVFFDNQWFLSYRESDKHVLGKNGIVKILNSVDGIIWNLVKEYNVEGFDLRNASFAINNNKLSAYIHGSKYGNDGTLLSFKDYQIGYNKDGGWQNLENVTLDKKVGYVSKFEGNQAYPWKITWYKSKAYTFAYGLDLFDLYTSSNGLQFNDTNSIQKIDGGATETTLKVNEKGVFYAIIRRMNANAMIGKSADFGVSWDWFGEIPIYDFGGPDFVFYKDGILLSGRESNKNILGFFDLKTNTYRKLMTIDSGGDCSYPGMVIKDGYLWMSYYSGHENKKGTSIYFSKINLAKLDIN